MRGKTRPLGDDTYEALAADATKLLHRPVTSGEIRSEKGPADGAGALLCGRRRRDRAIPEDQAPTDWVPAPPGMEDREATEVRGRSMIPLIIMATA